MEDVLVPIAVCGFLFVAMPWIVLHYITRWKTAATITNDDEALLEELYQLAKRLDDRMDTVERLVSADNPDFQPARITSERAVDGLALSEIEQLQLLQRSKGRIGK
ncbi:MAG: envelope stress response membrane protein PspB [Novosphingobium sp.]|nr:envelope stress response membrane protein PspB [Novosphingobium sp.]